MSNLNNVASPIAQDPDPWISGREAGRRLGIPHYNIPRVATAADLRRRVIPGRRVQYHAEDIEAIRADALIGRPVRMRNPQVASS